MGIANIPVTLSGNDFKGAEITPMFIVTDSDGNYRIDNIIPGNYMLTVNLASFGNIFKEVRSNQPEERQVLSSNNLGNPLLDSSGLDSDE